MEILKLREHSELASEAAEWFHSKWDIPVEEYAGSIQECLTGKSIVPQWYVAVENQQIIGGIGVIENDFHTTVLPPAAIAASKLWAAAMMERSAQPAAWDAFCAVACAAFAAC